MYTFATGIKKKTTKIKYKNIGLCIKWGVVREIYGNKLYETGFLQSMLFRALKNSAAEIGSSPKQFREKIATLLKAIEFSREGHDPSTVSL